MAIRFNDALLCCHGCFIDFPWIDNTTSVAMADMAFQKAFIPHSSSDRSIFTEVARVEGVFFEFDLIPDSFFLTQCTCIPRRWGCSG